MPGSLMYNDRRYYTLQKAAELLGVDARELEARYLARRLPITRIGSTLYIEADALYAALGSEHAESPEVLEQSTAPPLIALQTEYEEPRIVQETIRPRVQPRRFEQRARRANRWRSLATTLAAVAVVASMPIAAAMLYPTMSRGFASMRSSVPAHLSLGSLLSGMRSQLAAVFILGDAVGGGGVATTTPPLDASKVLAQNALTTLDSTSTNATSTSVQPIYYVYNYPVIERIKYEAPNIVASSSADYDAKLQELYNKIESQILTLSQNTSSQAAQTYQVIAQTNRIDQLSSVDMTSSHISGGTISGTEISNSPVAATSLTVSGDSNVATTTVTGDLTLSGSLRFTTSSSTINAVTASTTNLLVTNATSTNATSTNLFATSLGASLASTTDLLFVNATGTNAYLSGSATIGGNLTVNGNSITLGTSTTNSLIVNSAIRSNLVPDQNITYDLGSPSFYWRNAYVGTLNANNISAASTSIGGTASNDFTINSDNATADTEDMNLIFFRGNVVPNALLSWNSAANKKRFEFNQAVAISNASASTTNPTFTLTGTAGQSANILQIASSTGTSIFTVGPNGDTTVGGNLTVAGITNLTGALSLVNASTSLLSVFQHAYFGGTATSTFDSGGNLLLVNNGLVIGTNQLVAAAGNVGVGTSSPFRKLSVTDTVSAPQLAIAYDGTRYTQLQTDASGDYHINPSGQDIQTDDSNVWVCSGGACPSGTPSGTGNLIVESKLGVGTSTPQTNLQVGNGGGAAIDSSEIFQFANNGGVSYGTIRSTSNTLYLGTQDAGSGTFLGSYTSSNLAFRTSGTDRVTVTSGGNVGVGTTSPSSQLAVQSLIYVGANGATGMGTATSTFQGDIKITGKLDVGTIDPPYTIDGVKYATYGASTVGVHEEVVLKVTPTAFNTARKLYDYAIDFSSAPKGSNVWLFYQVTDLGAAWEHLVVTLTPGFDGHVFYEQDVPHQTLHILSDKSGPISVRLIGNRYDFTKWQNLRADQDGNTEGTHVISSKPSAQ